MKYEPEQIVVLPMNRAAVAFAMGCIAVALMLGCDNSSSVGGNGGGNDTAADSPPRESSTDSDPLGAIELRTVDRHGYDAAIASHKGKVVLVDCWATWCPPCIEGLPKVTKWSREYAEQGFVVVSLSLDTEKAAPKALEVLREHGAAFDNLRSEFGAGVKSTETFEIRGGAIPFYKLYDRTGKLRYEFCGDPEGLENVEAIDKIETRMKELLAEAAT